MECVIEAESKGSERGKFEVPSALAIMDESTLEAFHSFYARVYVRALTVQ